MQGRSASAFDSDLMANGAHASVRGMFDFVLLFIFIYHLHSHNRLRLFMSTGLLYIVSWHLTTDCDDSGARM